MVAHWKGLDERQWLLWIEEEDAVITCYFSSKSGKFALFERHPCLMDWHDGRNEMGTRHSFRGRRSLNKLWARPHPSWQCSLFFLSTVIVIFFFCRVSRQANETLVCSFCQKMNRHKTRIILVVDVLTTMIEMCRVRFQREEAKRANVLLWLGPIRSHPWQFFKQCSRQCWFERR